MARLRDLPVDMAGVPVELLDHGHRVWRDPVLWQRWMARHGLPTDPVGNLWCDRFNAAADAWARSARLLTDPKWVAERRRLADVGVLRVTALERGRARSEMGLLPGQPNHRP